MPSRQPAYQRLGVDERRAQLLELGTHLFTRFSYDELSMARIAREAGISKALLYHYFPSKQAYFIATLEAKASELEALFGTTGTPDPGRTAAEQIMGAVDTFLAWIDDNAVAYTKFMHASRVVPEVGQIVDGVRNDTARSVLQGLTGSVEEAPPPLRAAVRAWLWFMDGAILDWIERRDMSREQLAGLILGTLMGAITASGHGEILARLAEPPVA